MASKDWSQRKLLRRQTDALTRCRY